MARSSSSLAVIFAISLMNGLAELAAVVVFPWVCDPDLSPPGSLALAPSAARCARSAMDRRHALRRLLLHEAEQVAGNAPHLDLLGALGDAVAAVVAVDVLELRVPRVAHAAMGLHGLVGGLAAEAVGHVVAHGHL